MNCTFEKVAKLICEKTEIVLLCHARPDGDTLGSAYALKYALEENGKNVTVECADEIPRRLAFVTELSAVDRTRNTENTAKKPFICAIDVAETHLLGALFEKYPAIDLKIDHHPNGSEYAKYNYIDGKAAACGEIIFRLIRRLAEMRGGSFTPAACTALYTAISSDTGCFRYSNTTPDTLRISAELIEGGADSYDVNRRLYETKSRAELEAKKLMLNETEFYADGRVAILVITNEFRKKSGADDEEIGGLVSEMREIEGVDLAITVKQDKNDEIKFKISMRSSLNVCASDMCQMFGGGGHERAAGGALCALSPMAAKKEILEKVLKAL